MIDVDWYVEDPDAAEYVLTTAEELAGLAAIVNGTATAPVTTYAASEASTIKDNFKGRTIKLGANIDLNEVAWTPIGDNDNPFLGNFDGQNCTVSNLYVKNEGWAGLIGHAGKAAGSTVKNVTVDGATILSNRMAGAVVGQIYGSVDNCHVKDASIMATPNAVGNGYDNGGQTTSDIKKMQAELGITADGKWGPASVEASGGLTADEAYTAWMNGTLGEYVDPTGGSEIPESIKNKCASFKSKTELESYLEGLEFAGTISHDQALQLMAEYVDNNEKYIQDGNGNNTSTPSYREMVKNTNGWTVDSKGGANLLGIDQNAKVTAPDGTTMTLKNLREKLKFEGMTQSEANKVIKTLQQNLGISDNWLFGW